MKIAIYHQLPSGGGKRALYEFVKGLRSQHDITLYTHRDGEAYLSLTKLVHNVVWLPEIAQPKSLSEKLFSEKFVRDYDRSQAELAEEIDVQGYDLVFVHPSRFIQSPSLMHYLRTPSLYYSQEIRRVWHEKRLRDTTIGKGLRSSIVYRKQRQLAELDSRNVRAAGHICVNSFHSAEAHKRAHGVDTEVMYLGIDTSDLQLPRGSRPQDEPIQLLQVGGMEPYKNQLSLVEAAIILAADDLQLELHFIFDRFDPAYREQVEARIKQGQITAIFHHSVSQNELTKRYARADLTVCLADLEPFGLTPLESMALNTPVVAIREGGYRETIRDGVNGTFAHSLDPSHIADAITRALKLKREPKNLREYVEREWNWPRAIEQLEQTMKVVSRMRDQ